MNSKNEDEFIQYMIYDPVDNQTVKKPKESLDIKEYMKIYRKNNPEKWYKPNICSLCGGRYQNCGKTMHVRSKKHRNFIDF